MELGEFLESRLKLGTLRVLELKGRTIHLEFLNSAEDLRVRIADIVFEFTGQGPFTLQSFALVFSTAVDVGQGEPFDRLSYSHASKFRSLVLIRRKVRASEAPGEIVDAGFTADIEL